MGTSFNILFIYYIKAIVVPHGETTGAMWKFYRRGGQDQLMDWNGAPGTMILQAPYESETRAQCD